ncbi:MAG: hypothetical protein IT518_21130 [Burkholderiales bacterium]|nr:hypothetical protein [Burkholderiales bacterium]
MKTAVLLAAAALAAAAHAATPAQEKRFVDTYRKAYEGKDHKALVSLLYTKGADAKALAFYKMMLGAELGGKIAAIELAGLTDDDRKRIESMQGPDGRTAKLVLPPTRKLVVRTGTSDKSGSSSATSEVFVGEADGRLWILVPAAAR